MVLISSKATQNDSKTKCCRSNVFQYEFYNSDISTCCKDGVKQIGTC